MPLTESLFSDADKNKKASGGSSMVDSLKGTYTANKGTINAAVQAAVLVGVLRVAANYM